MASVGIKSDFVGPFWITMEIPCAQRQFFSQLSHTILASSSTYGSLFLTHSDSHLLNFALLELSFFLSLSLSNWLNRVMRFVFNGLSEAPSSRINTIYQLPISHRLPPFRSSYTFQSPTVYIVSAANTTLYFSYLPTPHMKQNLTLTTLFVQKYELITNTWVQAYTKVLPFFISIDFEVQPKIKTQNVHLRRQIPATRISQFLSFPPFL